MKSIFRTLVLAACLCLFALPARCEPAAPLSALAQMPVKEITVFKDGHVFVLHQGPMPTDGAGNVLLDYLPMPVLGTFWPYVADKNATLNSVTVSQRRVLVERTALTLRDLLEANPGADIRLLGDDGKTPYPARIVGVPTASSEELAADSPPSTDEKLPLKGDIILLKTSDGVLVEPINRLHT